MVKFKCKYGHSKFKVGGLRYETEPDGLVLTEDKKIIDFLSDNINFVLLELPPTPATIKEEATVSSPAGKKARKK